MKVDAPGIYAMPMAAYLADPCPEPSLSSSIARELIARSAQHAWWAHPKLNPAYQPDVDDKFDLGTAAHAYLLEGETAFAFVEAPDWRSKLAQAARDDARAGGKVALLTSQWTRVINMAAAARAQLAAFEDPPIPLAGGRPERTVVWQDEGLWCRARLDWLHEDGLTVDDYKTVSGSANPETWSRSLFNMGYEIQAAFHLRGLKAVTGKTARFRFIVQETEAPYALAVISLAPDAAQLAERKVRYALALWRECLETQRWPGYPRVTCYAEAPPWESTRWLAQEMRAPLPSAEEGSLADQLFGGRR